MSVLLVTALHVARVLTSLVTSNVEIYSRRFQLALLSDFGLVFEFMKSTAFYDASKITELLR